MIVCLPILVLMFTYGCDRTYGYQPFHRFLIFITDDFNAEAILFHLSRWSYGAAIVYLAVILQLAVYSYALPGEEVQGVKLRDGTHLTYKINGKRKNNETESYVLTVI